MDVREVVDTEYADEDFRKYRVKFWSRPGRIPDGIPVRKVGFWAGTAAQFAMPGSFATFSPGRFLRPLVTLLCRPSGAPVRG